jgi:hypothetical protein
MGQHLQDSLAGINWSNMSQGNRESVLQLRSFSTAVNDASLAALREVVVRLARALSWDEKHGRWMAAGQVPLQERWLPFRPIVFGGDDVTFLCNGQLSLSLATEYLAAFERQVQAHKLAEMHACAGIAIVKMHYPFRRAYDLSEQLTSNAKKHVRALGTDTSALDWHLAMSGLSGTLDAIRAREYERAGQTLIMRPLALRALPNAQDGRYWEKGVESVIVQFQSGPQWVERRNKVKGLRDPLRQGPEAVRDYVRDFTLPPFPELLPGARDVLRSGWSGDRCVYLDAIELMDHYVRLEQVEVQA